MPARSPTREPCCPLKRSSTRCDSSAHSTTRRTLSTRGTLRPHDARYPARVVRTRSMPYRPAASSSERQRSFTSARLSSAESPFAKSSKPIRSAYTTATSWWSAAMVSSPCLYRLATSSGIIVSSSVSFCRRCSSRRSCFTWRLRLMSLNASPRSPISSPPFVCTSTPSSPALTRLTARCSRRIGRTKTCASRSESRDTSTMIPTRARARFRANTFTGAKASEVSICATTTHRRPSTSSGAYAARTSLPR